MLVGRGLAFAQPSQVRLHFKEGDIRRVVTTEVLRLMMHFPQVDEEAAKPSIRTTEYFFTESIENVLPDGSAMIAASLDSFTTKITFGEGRHAEDFFHFNSAVDWDLKHTLHDIKTLPRAQFLGHTLRFTMWPDGTIKEFLNLQDFHGEAVGKGYDYDMVHALLSLSDSLRMGQLLELGFGGLAATKGEYVSHSTATEIPMMRRVTSTVKSNDDITVNATYYDAPKQIEYLEGIATPMGINKFAGGGAGEIKMKDGWIKHATYRDTANVVLQVDIDTVPEEITRIVTTDVYPIPVLHGGKVSIKEIEIHQATPKAPDPNDETLSPRKEVEAAPQK
jgi:hypothetical protein